MGSIYMKGKIWGLSKIVYVVNPVSLSKSKSRLFLLVDVGIEIHGEDVPVFCVLVDPDGYASAWALELAVTLLVNLDLALFPAEDVCPYFALVLGSDVHLDLVGTGVRHQASETVGTVVGAAADETDAVCLVPVVVLFTVSVEFAGGSHVGDLVAAGGRFGVFAFCAVEVAVENAGVSIFAQEDEGVSQRLHPPLYRRLYSLSFLCVVVLDACLKSGSAKRKFEGGYGYLRQRSQA